jgi:RimJ/RimL family protein N-acetyltransferase
MDKTESGAPPPSVSEISSRIEKWREAAASPLPGRLNLVVVDLSTPEHKVEGLSGFGHIATLEDGTRSGNVGVMLNPEARGKGYGAEAIRLSVEWGFSQGVGFGEESVGTLERNAGMMRVIEKVLVPRGWKGERRKLESGEWEWEYKISREGWEESEKEEN